MPGPGQPHNDRQAGFALFSALAVIGAWLANESAPWTPAELVEARVQCLPGWLLAD